MKHYFPSGRRNYGRHLKALLDTWDLYGSTSGPTPWQIYEDEDYYYYYDDDDDDLVVVVVDDDDDDDDDV